MIQSRYLVRLYRLGCNRTIKCQFATNHSLIPVKFHKITGKPEIFTVRRLRNAAGSIRKTVRNVSEERKELATEEESEKFHDDENKEENESYELTVPGSSAVEKFEETDPLKRLLTAINYKKDDLNEGNIVYYLKRASGLSLKKRSESTLQEIKNSQEFSILLKNFTRKINSFHVDEIVDALKYLKTLKVSHNSVIIHQILRIAKEEFNSLSFHKAIFLYFYVKDINNNRDAFAIKTGLEVAFPILMKKSFDKNNDSEVRDALHLVEANVLTGKCVWPIVYAANKFCNELGAKYSTSIIMSLLQVLNVLPKTAALFEECRANTYSILKAIWQDIPTSKMRFILRNYAKLVDSERIKYDSVLIENMTNVVFKEATDPVYKFGVLRPHNFMRHIQYNVLDELTDILIDNPKILDGEFNYCNDYCEQLIESLARSDYNNVRKDKWGKLKPIIENLPYLDNESAWSSRDTFLANQLISLGIYNNKILNYLSDKYNTDEIFNLHPIKLEVLLVLNQAIALWYPDFKKPFISDKYLSAIIGNHPLYGNEPSNSYVKTALEEATGVENSVLLSKHTEQGYVISDVLALNEKNEPISFKELTVPRGISIEEFKSELNCKHMVLILYETNLHGRNLPILQEFPSLKLKTLNALGHIVVSITSSSWYYPLCEQERGIYLWKCIQDKIKERS